MGSNVLAADTTTTGAFKYIDPATITAGTKPWAKVDSDVTSFRRTERRRPVSDIRSQSPGTFSTDASGFAVYRAPLSAAAAVRFDDDVSVRGPYYDSVEALLREKLPGVGKVVMFDHTIRRHAPDAARQPVQQVHVDQTPEAAAARVRRHLDRAEADEVLASGRRFQIINVWRPIGHAATDFPLAVVDWRSTRPEDLVRVDLLYPIRAPEHDDGDDRGKEVRPDPASAQSSEGYQVKGETYAVAPNEDHRFYYVKDMTPDEAMFIKCFDSWSQGQPGGREGIAALTPHTAFIDPATPPGTKGRESIEVRCLVFYE